MLVLNNPFAPPPSNISAIKDLNTGLACTETYKQRITKPGKQVLLPVIFYLDGATTGQFSALSIEALKFSLGIFTRKARQKDHMWRILGYIPQVTHHKSRGRRITIDSNHVDSVMAHPDALNDEGNQPATNVERAQDFHAMLSTVLASYIELQETGFVWDLYYRGQVYKNIEFILFTPFMKVDGDEADKL